MNTLGRMVCVSLMIVSAWEIEAQVTGKNSKSDKEPAGTITGRVTTNNEPSAGVRVNLSPDNEMYSPGQSSFVQAITDTAGRFKLTKIPAGTYTLTAAGVADILSNEGRSGLPGKSITLHEDEEIKDLDLSLERGGVI